MMNRDPRQIEMFDPLEMGEPLDSYVTIAEFRKFMDDCSDVNLNMKVNYGS